MDKAIHTAAHQRLCSHLRDLRERAGLRQSDIATALGKPQSFVSSYESGQRRLDLTELDQLAETLDTSLQALVDIYVGSSSRK